MIKPVGMRAEEYVKAGVVATSALDMARSLLATLGQERKVLEDEVWSHQVSAQGYFDLRARHTQLAETIEIIEKIVGHMEGKPVTPRRLPHLRRPETPYGER